MQYIYIVLACCLRAVVWRLLQFFPLMNLLKMEVFRHAAWNAKSKKPSFLFETRNMRISFYSSVIRFPLGCCRARFHFSFDKILIVAYKWNKATLVAILSFVLYLMTNLGWSVKRIQMINDKNKSTSAINIHLFLSNYAALFPFQYFC